MDHLEARDQRQHRADLARDIACEGIDNVRAKRTLPSTVICDSKGAENATKVQKTSNFCADIQNLALRSTQEDVLKGANDELMVPKIQRIIEEERESPSVEMSSPADYPGKTDIEERISEEFKLYVLGRLTEDEENSLEETIASQDESLSTNDWKLWFKSVKCFAKELRDTDHKGLSNECQTWMHEQRVQYADGHLCENQEAILGEMMLLRTPRANKFRKRGWLKIFQTQAQSYKERERGASYENLDLVWFYNQKTSYREENLDVDQIDLMESLPNWNWAQRSHYEYLSEQWMKSYNLRATEYQKAEGKDLSSGFRVWLRRQYLNFLENKLDASQKELLNELPCWKDLLNVMEPCRTGVSEQNNLLHGEHKRKREQPIKLLEGDLEQNGLVCKHWVEGYARRKQEYDTLVDKTKTSIGFQEWQDRQYCSFLDGKLDASQKNLLNKLPCWQGFLDEMESFRRKVYAQNDVVDGEHRRELVEGDLEQNGRVNKRWLEAYNRTKQDCDALEDKRKVSSEFEVWQDVQYCMYLKGRLNGEQKDLLNQLPCWRDLLERRKPGQGNTNEQHGRLHKQWVKGYHRWKQEYDTLDDKTKISSEFGLWQDKQYCTYLKGKLNSEQKDLLNQLSCWRDLLERRKPGQGGRCKPNGCINRQWLEAYNSRKQEYDALDDKTKISHSFDKWQQSQYCMFLDGKHDALQRDLLNKLPCWLDFRDEMEQRRQCLPECTHSKGDEDFPLTEYTEFDEEDICLYVNGALSGPQAERMEEVFLSKQTGGRCREWIRNFKQYAAELRNANGMEMSDSCENWIYKQTILYLKDDLQRWQQALMTEALLFTDDTRDDMPCKTMQIQWFNAARKCVKGLKDSKTLSPSCEVWIQEQASFYITDLLTGYQKYVLEALLLTRNELSFSKYWKKWFKTLRDCAKIFGETGGVVCTSENKLSQWVYRQRMKFQQESLSPLQILLLEKIPHWGWFSERDALEKEKEILGTMKMQEGQAGNRQDVPLVDLDEDALEDLRMACWSSASSPAPSEL